MQSMDKKTEKILVKNCLRNDRLSQKQLFDQYKDAMYTLCFRITANEEDAKDALQDGFIAVFNSLSSFSFKSTLGAWIKTIIVRTAIRKIKKLHFDSIENIEDETYTFDESLNGEMLHTAIMMLDPGFRSVFILYEVEGYSHKEIAEIAEISLGTSKSQLHYAKKKLKSIIVNQFEYER